tara:strand:- start:2369 stop:3007 length:639 start_codon:yes stop_codon:yes gene_type:complete
MLLDLDQLFAKYKLKINGILQIGAHFGEEYPSYLKHDIKHIVFFEPLTHCYHNLVNNLMMYGIEEREVGVVQSALGSEHGFVEMYVDDKQGASSSILKPKQHLEQHPTISFPNREKVEVITLDSFWEINSEVKIEDYNFINIDVQGYELEVFKGAAKTLESIDYIMTEINRDEVYEHCALVDSIDGFLENYGFRRVETSWAGGTWGDGFYIK